MPFATVDGRRVSAVGAFRATDVAILILDGVNTRCCDEFTEVYIYSPERGQFEPVTTKRNVSRAIEGSKCSVHEFSLDRPHGDLRLSHEQSFEAGGPRWTIGDEPLASIIASSLSYRMTQDKCIQFGRVAG